MALRGGGDSPADIARREAAAWIVRMQGADAEMARLDFERWRARDPLNRRTYAEMERISRLARRLGETGLGRDYQRKGLSRGFFAAPGLRVAFATVLVLVLAGVGALYFERAPVVPAGAGVAAATPVATAVGEIHSVRLADGTMVTLDTDSAIEPEFSAMARRVRLVRGRARFDVAADTGRPFMVVADGRTILDRGTVFDVALGREGVKVVLLRGAVEVRDARAGLTAAVPLARLVPGQVFADTPASGAPLVSAAPRGGELWVKGMLSFDGAPLEQVLAEGNRYSAHRIRLGDPALGSLRVTGTFHAVPTAALADMLAATFHLRVEHGADGDFILRPR